MPQKLVFFVAEDWYFYSHRLPLAQAALQCGFEVVLITCVHSHAAVLQAAGIRLIPIAMSRRSLNPLAALGLIIQLIKIYRRERPTILHQVALKPILYGSLAARLAGVPSTINALAGLGFVFSSRRLEARLLRPLAGLALRALLGGARTQVIFQNPDDAKLIGKLAHLTPAQVHLIPGSGVDLNRFQFTPEPPGTPIIMLPARLLWDKGVGEWIAAAKQLQAQKIVARWVLVGAPDPGNPAAVPEAQIQAWVKAGLIEWWGAQTDMPSILAQSHIVCLPSYREGLPKVLAEAAACGRPIITSDAPGCREVVKDGINGLLIPPRNSIALAQALAQLIQDPALRLRYGQAGRHWAEANLGVERVIHATLALYHAQLQRLMAD